MIVELVSRFVGLLWLCTEIEWIEDLLVVELLDGYGVTFERTPLVPMFEDRMGVKHVNVWPKQRATERRLVAETKGVLEELFALNERVVVR